MDALPPATLQHLAQAGPARELATLLRRIQDCRTLGFTARRLHLSQAALLQRLSDYEAALGLSLVHAPPNVPRKGSSPLRLTPQALGLLKPVL